MGTVKDTKLRGSALRGADQKDAVDNSSAGRNSDAELHLDDEKDSLYDDGLDVEDETETLADTKGVVNRG